MKWFLQERVCRIPARKVPGQRPQQVQRPWGRKAWVLGKSERPEQPGSFEQRPSEGRDAWHRQGHREVWAESCEVAPLDYGWKQGEYVKERLRGAQWGGVQARVEGETRGAPGSRSVLVAPLGFSEGLAGAEADPGPGAALLERRPALVHTVLGKLRRHTHAPT